ncbi:FBP domain-containing protein [Microbispora cellulosiformans]|uniref:FBP domain-containing protein n=1 Tax=Microbispora cellulosiformans TaxID=2614688 RepID=A0A5J5KAX1_9ACTN|nr:FBP domain-containing protein [Microbispora cellulosiformans]KAA9381996.1 FBP domain-containing protein [Microbispora cellulosiformans]
MRPVTEHEVRTSFINCSKGEAKRLDLPRDLADRPWEDLDFLGWRDPGAPERAYVVAERDDSLVGIALRVTSGVSRGFTSRSMCSLCLTTHTSGGVALMTARRTGEAGRQGNTVGQYLCTDLDCSLYLRGKKEAPGAGVVEESLTVEEKVARTRANLYSFLDRVAHG